MEFDLIIRLPAILPQGVASAIAQTIAVAIEHGREWGQRFLNDSSWRGNKKKMAKYAIKESSRWTVWNGFTSGLFGIAEIPSQVGVAIYSQIKLAATLFTIYDIDTTKRSTQALVLAAAAGVSVAELANYLPTNLTTNTPQPGIEKTLMSIPGKTFVEIHKNLGIRLLANTGGISVNTNQVVPHVGSTILYPQPPKAISEAQRKYAMAAATPERNIANQVDEVSMNACGNTVINFINTWKQG